MPPALMLFVLLAGAIISNRWPPPTGATIISNSLQLCHDQCVDRNLAFPLAHGQLGWPNISLTNCDFDCLIDACRLGCQDFEKQESTCDLRCDPIGTGSAACRQGCRALADVFLHQIQGLIDLVSVEAFPDPLRGVGLNWSFPEAQMTALQEIQTTATRWATQSRAAGKGQGWHWTEMDQKAFNEDPLRSTLFVPVQQFVLDIELRLAAIWRDFVVVSSRRLISQTLPPDSLPPSNSRPKLTEGPLLQLSASSFVVCWNTERPNVHDSSRFQLRLFSAEETPTTAEEPIAKNLTSSTCHLFRNLPNGKTRFRLTIADLGPADDGQQKQQAQNSENAAEQQHQQQQEQTRKDLDESNGSGKESQQQKEDGELSLEVNLEQMPRAEEEGGEGDPSPAGQPLLAFTDGTAIYVLDKMDDFVMLTEPAKVGFALNQSQSITALGALSPSDLLVGLSDGSIFRLDLSKWSPSNRRTLMTAQENTTTQGEGGGGGGGGGDESAAKIEGQRIRAGDNTGGAVTQIVVDHLQERLYALRDKMGIIRCQLHSCVNSTTLTPNSSPNFVQQIAVDPWNGFLYYTTNNGDPFSAPLLPLDSAHHQQQQNTNSLSITRRLAELPALSTLEVDLREQKLMAVTKGGQLMSRDLVDNSVQDERQSWTLVGDPYKNVLRSQLNRNRLFWLSSSCGDSFPWDSCLFSEEFHSEHRTVHASKYLFAGAVKEFTLLRPFFTPPFMIPPSKLGLLLTDSEALISWRPPMSLPFQAPGFAWRSLSYEYILQFTSVSDQGGTSSAATIISQGSISQLHLNTPINAYGEYFASVKACTRTVCSRPIAAKNKPIRVEPLKATISLLVKKPPSMESAPNGIATLLGQTTPLDMLGKEIPTERALLYPRVPSDPQANIIAFDNSSSLLYISSRKEFAVFRRNDAGAMAPFLSTAHVHQMALIASRATILLATAYSVLAYRTTSSFDRIVYNCLSPGSGDCGEVIGIASELDSAESAAPGRLFLLVQLPSGTLQLLSTGNDLQEPLRPIGTVSAANPLQFKIRQMAFADERLLFLTDDGLFGTLDLSLESLNFNLAIRDVQHLLLSADNAGGGQDKRIHFEGPIQFDEKSGQLSWSVGGPQLLATMPKEGAAAEVAALFKLTFSRDESNSGGERSVTISQISVSPLPARLVQAWNSRQRFDVQVEAINPWTTAIVKRSGLNAPTKPPTAPQNVRIYATQQKTVDGTRAIINLFWEEPREWNGDKLGYQANCSISQPAGQQSEEPSHSVNGTLKQTQRAFSFSVRSGKINCRVFAMNDQHLVGPPSEAAEIDGSDFKPLIRLFAIDSTENLVAIQNWRTDAQKGTKARFRAKNRRRRGRRQIHSSGSQYQTITFVGNELYAVRKEADMSQLVRLEMDRVEMLSKTSLVGEFAQIDAIAADWVANRLLLVGNRELLQVQLDQLQQDSGATVLPKRLLSLSMGAQDAKQLVFDPFTNTAYLLTKNGSLFALDLNKGTETNLELTTGCLRQKTVTSIVGEFTWNRAAPPQLYALTWNGLIELKLNADNCPDINVNWSLFGEQRGLKTISLFAVADKVFVFATQNELLVYDRSAAAVSQLPIASPPLRQLLAVSQSSQPFPDRDCFQLPPAASSLVFTVRNEGRTGAVLEVQEARAEQQLLLSPECQNISQPPAQYEVHFRKRGTDKEKIVHSSSNRTVLDQGVLDKNADYDVSVGWFNRYWPVQGGQQSPPKLLHTGFGFPSAPKDVSALALSPDTVLLSWTQPDLLSAPASEIRYRISQQSPALLQPVPVAVRPQQQEGAGPLAHFSSVLADVVPCERTFCQAKVPNLRPSTDYHFWVMALHISRLNAADDPEATSGESHAHTLDIAGTLGLENVTSDSILLRWNTLSATADSVTNVQQRVQVSVNYRQSGVDASWTELYNSSFDPASSLQRFILVNNLRAATTYDYRFGAEYTVAVQKEDGAPRKESKESFFQQAQQARTKAGTPSAPTNIRLVNEQQGGGGAGEGSGGGWTLRWTVPESDGGEPIQNYAVEYRPDSRSEWEIAERGLPPNKLSWRVAWAESHSRHGKEPSDAELARGQFRVRAANSEGFGEFGCTTDSRGQSDEQTEGGRTGGWLLWALLVLLLVILACSSGSYCFVLWKVAQRRKLREELHKPICLQSISQQIQLTQSPFKYSPEVQNELKILPKVPSDRVRTTVQLGMGSFGRVCEGFMRMDRDVSVRVAIKYLKDNCDENRVKFLKEAILMNNFDHPNIVKLLGVCLEGENFLVLELMDGGDLRHFLLECRPKKDRPSRLCLRDLMAMAVDVGRGCLHLETYKHVHRDIAARNCLISSKSSPQRVTKIADFGLARSLFADDYYRFHGGDMLPLRWLSPEAITQGMFTSKSDVWAFGVLLWEIFTMGEQPYPNTLNTQVINLISQGIPPERPVECPNELWEVMRATWTKDPERRPKFEEIQPKMESIRGLAHLQSRESFPSLLGTHSFDTSQESSCSTRESSTTTTNNGGAAGAESSSIAGMHFEKSECSFSKRPNRRQGGGARQHNPQQLQNTRNSSSGQQQGSGSAFSTTTTTTGLDISASADYEVPIHPAPNHPAAKGGGSTGTCQLANQRTAFQNDAFVADSPSVENQWTTRSQQSLLNRSLAPQNSPRQFGTSSSRVSRV